MIMARNSVRLDHLPAILVGVSGEYFVAAELSRKGYVASLTLRNTRGIDVLVGNSDASKSVGIQVKTNRGNKKSWVLSEKAETYFSDTLFYVFVNLIGPNERPAYHVVPSKTVAEFLTADHRAWLAKSGKRGKPHQDNPVRVFVDKESKYLDKWELLGLDSLKEISVSSEPSETPD